MLKGLSIADDSILRTIAYEVSHYMPGVVVQDMPLGEWVLTCRDALATFHALGSERVAIDNAVSRCAHVIASNHRLVGPEKERVALEYLANTQQKRGAA